MGQRVGPEPQQPSHTGYLSPQVRMQYLTALALSSRHVSPTNPKCTGEPGNSMDRRQLHLRAFGVLGRHSAELLWGSDGVRSGGVDAPDVNRTQPHVECCRPFHRRARTPGSLRSDLLVLLIMELKLKDTRQGKAEPL